MLLSCLRANQGSNTFIALVTACTAVYKGVATKVKTAGHLPLSTNRKLEVLTVKR